MSVLDRFDNADPGVSVRRGEFGDGRCRVSLGSMSMMAVGVVVMIVVVVLWSL